jgi:hypothetical protein
MSQMRTQVNARSARCLQFIVARAKTRDWTYSTSSGPEFSSRAGDTGRIEGVVVHRTSGGDACNSALVVSQVMRIEQIVGRTAGEPRIAGGVGLGKVESGGTPARHTLSEHLCTRTRDRATQRRAAEQRCGNSLPLALFAGGRSRSHGRVRRQSVLGRDGAQCRVCADTAPRVQGE